MAALQDSDVEELTSSLMVGLKSWLSMGMAMAPMSGLTLESSEEAAASSAESKLAKIMAKTKHAADFRREGGIKIAAGESDALTTMAEEQAHRVLFLVEFVSSKFHLNHLDDSELIYFFFISALSIGWALFSVGHQ